MEGLMEEDYALDDAEDDNAGAPEEAIETSDKAAEDQEGAAEEAKPARKRVVKNPRPKLNKDRLASAKGIPELLRMSKNMHWRGKGHELHDLDTTLSVLEHWSHRLFPQLDSDNFFSTLERLGTKREVQTYMRKLRMGLEGDPADGDQPFVEKLDDVIVEEEEEPTFEDPFSSLLGPSLQADNQQMSSTEVPPSQHTNEASQELLDRMERSRQQALERRRLRLAQQEHLLRDMDSETGEPTSVLDDSANIDQKTETREEASEEQSVIAVSPKCPDEGSETVDLTMVSGDIERVEPQTDTILDRHHRSGLEERTESASVLKSQNVEDLETLDLASAADDATSGEQLADAQLDAFQGHISDQSAVDSNVRPLAIDDSDSSVE
ncbi:TIMELESS-interacting protein [Amblyomma americanum]